MSGPRILVWHDKHGNFTYGGDDAALKIVQERVNLGYLFWPEDADEKARKILADCDESAALDFIRERNDQEYERVTEDFIR